MENMWSILGPFLLILCGVLSGVCGAALTHWTLIRFLRELEYRVTDLEERLIREVKSRVGKIGVEKRAQEAQLETWAKEQVENQKATVPTFTDWYRSKMTK